MDEFEIQLTKPRFMLATCKNPEGELVYHNDYLLDKDSFKMNKFGCTCDVYDIEYRSDKNDYDILFVGKKLGTFSIGRFINSGTAWLDTDNSMRLILDVKSNIEKAIFDKLFNDDK